MTSTTEIQCCETWITYPAPGQTAQCSGCGSTFVTSTTQGAPVFDMLTLDDLYELHSRLCAQEREIHATLMDGMTPLISPLSDEWRLQAARCEDITQTADAAWAEIQRREQENVDA